MKIRKDWVIHGVLIAAAFLYLNFDTPLWLDAIALLGVMIWWEWELDRRNVSKFSWSDVAAGCVGLALMAGGLWIWP